MKPTFPRTHLPSRSLKWLLLVAFVVSLFPVPLGQSKPTGDPYPCMHRPCGCSSAEQCWQSCCCFNDEQKLAWAAKNGVTPPTWFLAKMSREKSTEKKTCCSKCSGNSCCDKKPVVTETVKSCCKKTEPSGSPKTQQPRSKNGFRWLVLDDALRCKGSFVSFDKGIPKLPSAYPPLMISMETATLPIELNDFSCSVGLSPPTPPPRS